ncbi:hypothetical protein [Halobacillus sp. BBL2006]|uniref:hypothetical protein n=1 Tax=Halobacillus sp. BBL2006 TaxID=1543706 RepID=UPI0012E004EB|nr:hypothetical protein [Halobacillus sp. BBL2006]
MVGLLYLMISTYHELQTAIQRASEDSFTLLMTMSLWSFLFGILMGWKALYNIIFEKRIKVNWIIILSVLLAITSFIPRVYWVKWLSLDLPFFIEMFQVPETQILLTAFSGLLFIRSLDGKRN